MAKGVDNAPMNRSQALLATEGVSRSFELYAVLERARFIL